MMMSSPQKTDDQLFESVFRQIGDTDFPTYPDAYQKLLSTGLKVAMGGSIRMLNKECRWFFEENNPPWPRYDAYLAYWGEADPRCECDEDEETDVASAMPPEELLAHRIIMAFYAEKRRLRYFEGVSNRPLWMLTVIEDGQAYPECLNEAHLLQRFDSAYWTQKKLPCERLFCRCRITAFTNEEAAARSGQ